MENFQEYHNEKRFDITTSQMFNIIVHQRFKVYNLIKGSKLISQSTVQINVE